MAPEFLGLLGVGPITAAQILVSWSHQGRFRSEAVFASFAGVSPIPASSGLTDRHRLSRGGDRQLNRAMHAHLAPDATWPRHGGPRRPQNHRREDPSRRAALPQASHLPLDLQDPRTD
ncbi:transposase [Streptomyces sp. NRRL WC-3549]|uniref:transposase n=1 Tax=Streptomyces sp. NRRL WC-3549 TaxID=1463925 RepID=UPI0009E97D89|nr:transposase [Streptomyces sp. NRRL WC-3549]